jgi:hypothetical protein
MTRFILVVSIFSAAMTLPAQMRVVGRVDHETMAARSDEGARELEAREILVEAPSAAFASDVAERGEILLLFDPGTKLFWWRYQTSMRGAPGGILRRDRQSARFYVGSDRIVGFLFLSPSLWFRESFEHLSSLDQGESNVLALLAANRASLVAGQVELFRELNLHSHIDVEGFFHSRRDASPWHKPRLREVARDKRGWRIELEGSNGEPAEVWLNDRFEPYGAKR